MDRPASATVAAGFAGGVMLGFIARAWMRLIATDPAFSWTGTVFVIGGFAFFGLTQAVAAAARRGAPRRRTITAARLVGAVGVLPLFVAAGALLAPTVIGGGLATARNDWRRPPRLACVGVACAPVLFVGHDLVDGHGWSLRAAVGSLGMIAIYAVIVRATRATIAPVDGRRPPTTARST